MEHEVKDAVSICLTGEHVISLESQVSLGSISLEMDPELWRKDHNGNSGGGLTTKFGQHLPI